MRKNELIQDREERQNRGKRNVFKFAGRTDMNKKERGGIRQTGRHTVQERVKKTDKEGENITKTGLK